MIHLLDAMGLGKTEILAIPERKTTGTQDPVGIKATDKSARVDRKELTATYLADPICFNGINKITQAVMSAGFEIANRDGDSNAGYFEVFVSKVGKRGGETDWNSIVEGMLRDAEIYGQCFIELIHDEDGKQILDIDLLDTTRMDYLRDGNENVALDKFGNPIGYTLTMPDEYLTDPVESKFQPEEPYELKNNQIYFPPERIAHIKLFTYEDRLFPIGLLEPIYRITRYKMNLETAITNALELYSIPHMHAKIGDITHDSSPDQIKKVLGEVKKNLKKGIYATPYYYDLSLIEAQHLEHLTEELSYYINQQITGLGIPKSFVTGGGEETNRSTLVIQEHLHQLSLKNIIGKVNYGIETQIFKPIAEKNLLSESYPKIVWGELAVEDINSKAERLSNYARYGLVSPEIKLENMIRVEEGLPQITEDERTARTPSGTDSETDEEQEQE